MTVNGMTAVKRAELYTRDMDLLASLFRKLYVEHTPSFRCPDPAQARGMLRSAAVGGLHASLTRYGGFTYSAELSPSDSPIGCVNLRGSGAVIATAREELRVPGGGVFMMPAHLPSTAMADSGDAMVLRVPWSAAGALAEETAGLPAASLRFEAMAPVSAAAARAFARTGEFVCGLLVTSGAAEIHPLLVPELTRLTAAAFLETFPNTAMTTPYLPGPEWVTTAAVHRAAAFIDAHADQPVTVAEITAAAGVPPRALRCTFRRSYGITPLGYLRRARLERAHLELRGAEPGDGVTVAGVARRWGWASPSWFTAAYRQRFGVPPGHTLRC